MGKIAILDDTLASQVAAGEVIERPASVVKELVENSLDAGAQHVTVEIRRGGTAMIRVTDDAVGMSREDALMSLERHATSKLQNSGQLSTILTLGFRGEAMPSIASVGRFRLTTRLHGSIVGTEVTVDAGKLKDVKDAGAPEGTSVELLQIFYNLPARRKFLRAETTEAAHVEHQVRLHALAAPGARFTYIRDGRTVFDLPATDDWRVRIVGLTNTEVAEHLIRVKQHGTLGMKVHGYLLPAGYARKGRRQQFVFLNGRPVEDSAISRALRDGFRGAIQDGNHPAAWLWLEMDPELVDVNVHPAKREVRFHRPHDVRSLIANATEEALTQKNQSSQPVVHRAAPPAPAVDDFVLPETKVAPDRAEDVVPEQQATPVNPPAQPAFPHRVEQQEELPTPSGEALVEVPDFKIIGPLHDRYVVLEGDEGVVLLDPCAARERVVYESLLAGMQHGGVESQGLLVAELLELDALDAELVMRHEDHFNDAGIAVEAFGGNTVKVSSLPAFLSPKDTRGFLLEVVDELVSTVGTRRGKAMAAETFAAGIARKAGMREVCRVEIAAVLLAEMFRCDLPYCTPDGSPTLIHISLNELDRKFGK